MNDLNIYSITSAIADPLRLSVMLYLLRGQATYAEIQQHLDVSQSNLSNHLAVLLKAGLVKKISNGRRNSYEIAGPEIAHLVEHLMSLQHLPKQESKIKPIAVARTCYDHVAGKLGVSIFKSLADQQAIIYYDNGNTDFSKQVELGINAGKIFGAFNVDLSAVDTTRRKYIYACLDWTEKQPHLAGAVGAAMCNAMMDKKWVVRNEEKRVLRVTDTGKRALREIIGLDFNA
ncbi:MAG: winged helix-turn-helix transcriptional regulator [Bacteroidetes bacterium]|nr:winged helix-turn-helix transcriptional regulator [Bacteroidota bacterium]